MSENEAKKIVLEKQTEAIARAIFVLGENRSLPFNEIMQMLAEAEKKANFVWGFVLLNNHKKQKEDLHKRLLNQNLIVENEKGHMFLTPKGEEKAKIKLPQIIEQYLL